MVNILSGACIWGALGVRLNDVRVKLKWAIFQSQKLCQHHHLGVRAERRSNVRGRRCTHALPQGPGSCRHQPPLIPRAKTASSTAQPEVDPDRWCCRRTGGGRENKS